MRLTSNRLRGEAERGDVHEVVAFVAGEGDGEAAVLVGPGAAGDVAGQRRDRDRRALDRKAVRTGDPAANDVRLREESGGVRDRDRGNRDREPKQVDVNALRDPSWSGCGRPNVLEPTDTQTANRRLIR